MTPDQDLSARLAGMDAAAVAPIPNIRFGLALIDAYRSGQLITLADHERAVQAAVAKAVEAERAGCIIIADDHMISHMPLVCDEDEWRSDEAARIAAAIRSRGVDG